MLDDQLLLRRIDEVGDGAPGVLVAPGERAALAQHMWLAAPVGLETARHLVDDGRVFDQQAVSRACG